MKRSEMVKHIQDLLNGGFYPNHTEHDADQFLISMQDKGMEPPALDQLSEEAQALMHIYIYPNLNQWEEDVAKDEKVQAAIRQRREALEKFKSETED